MTFKQPLSVAHPRLAKQAVGWDPSSLARGSDQIRTWRCENEHEYKSAVSNRVGDQGCSVCAGQKILVGFNDLTSVNPLLASQAFGWDPSIVTVNSHSS